MQLLLRLSLFRTRLWRLTCLSLKVQASLSFLQILFKTYKFKSTRISFLTKLFVESAYTQGIINACQSLNTAHAHAHAHAHVTI